jgi:hypothetical protein
LVDHLIHRVPSLHHQHHSPRFFQRPNQLLDRMGAYYLRIFGFVLDEFIHFGYGSIKHSHAITVVVHVQYQILAHYGQANQCDITILCRHKLP